MDPVKPGQKPESSSEMLNELTSEMAHAHDEMLAESTLASHQVRYVNAHSLCAMCDTKLEIHHEINLSALKVKEEAHCPSCGIRVRSNHHLMH